MDWLILNVDKNEFLVVLWLEVKGKMKGKGGDEVAAKDDVEGAIEVFVRVGFIVDVVWIVMWGVKGDVSCVFDDLCVVFGLSCEEVFVEVMEVFVDIGVDFASEDDIREVLRNV